MDRHVAEPPRHQRRVRQGGDTDGGIEAAADQIDLRVLQMQVDRDLRIGVEEIGQQGRDVQHPERHRRRQPHQPARRDRLGQGLAFRRLAFAPASAAARAASVRPASVNASRREVRLKSRAPSRASTRLTALDTVAFERSRSSAAREKDCSSATLAKIARPSRSGSPDIAHIPETMSFDCFYLCLDCLGNILALEIGAAGPPKGDQMIDVRPFNSARPRRPRLAQCPAPFLLRQLLRSQADRLGRAAGLER